MTTIPAGYSLIAIASGAVVATRGALPCRIDVPNVGVCDFDAPGQVMPDAQAPTHRLVARVLVDDPPGALYAPTGETEAYDPVAGRVVVTRLYPAAPNVMPPVPAAITRRQCARALYAQGRISGPELVAMTQTGAPPALVEALLARLPEAEQWVARADFAAQTYERGNPLLNSIMTAAGASAAEMDEFFIAAGGL